MWLEKVVPKRQVSGGLGREWKDLKYDRKRLGKERKMRIRK